MAIEEYQFVLNFFFSHITSTKKEPALKTSAVLVEELVLSHPQRCSELERRPKSSVSHAVASKLFEQAMRK